MKTPQVTPNWNTGIYIGGGVVATPETPKQETETFTLDCEYTDTFGGEANYSWVKRETLEMPADISDNALVRRAKKALGLNGVSGVMYSHGDMWEFRPHNSCTVAFFTVQY